MIALSSSLPLAFLRAGDEKLQHCAPVNPKKQQLAVKL
jgi:hypothetical protein